MIFRLKANSARFTQVGYFSCDEERKLFQELLWSEDPVVEWECKQMNYSDPSLPIPHFMALPMVGLFVAEEDLVARWGGFSTCQQLDISIEGKKYQILKPSVRLDTIDLDASTIRYADSPNPKLAKPVFFGNMPAGPLLFRVQFSPVIYANDGPGSFIEWYMKEGLTGLVFDPQICSKGDGS